VTIVTLKARAKQGKAIETRFNQESPVYSAIICHSSVNIFFL
jgi:hypothetical protein